MLKSAIRRLLFPKAVMSTNRREALHTGLKSVQIPTYATQQERAECGKTTGPLGRTLSVLKWLGKD